MIVVGAGPAGSIAAYETARAGHTTLLLEKFPLPRDKPCGGAVMYRGIQIVHGAIPLHIIEQKIYGLRFMLPGDKGAEFKSGKLIGITVFRSRFDEYLARRAEAAGAELIDEARVIKASVGQNSALVRLDDGREFTSEVIIGADGVNSIVSRSLGLRPEHKDLSSVGLGMEADFHVGENGVMKATNGDPSILEIIPVTGRTSYGWVFPKREHLAIGIAGASVHMQPLRPIFEAFRRKQETRLGVELIPEKRRTYFLGGDGLRGKNITNRALLIGDAAGFVDPMMGEGIAYAMRSGQFAANVIDDAFRRGSFAERSLSRYPQLCRDEFGANFAMAKWVGHQGLGFANSVLSKAQNLQMSSEIMVALSRGEMGYSNIPLQVLRKLPRELPGYVKKVVRERMLGRP